MHKINEYHRASEVVRMTKDRVRAFDKGALRKTRDIPTISYPQLELKLCPRYWSGEATGAV